MPNEDLISEVDFFLCNSNHEAQRNVSAIIRLNKQNKPIGETAKPLGVAKSTGGMYWLT